MSDGWFEVFWLDSPVSHATLVGHFHPPKASPEKPRKVDGERKILFRNYD
jgi:hypothetical protein